MMLASAATCSGTEKRESQSEAFQQNPFTYSFHPVPSTENGGYFLNIVALSFSVNKKSEKLDMANEFMRFIINTNELANMSKKKRMVTPAKDMSLDKIYESFESIEAIYVSQIGLSNDADVQVRLAGSKVANGSITVEEAISNYGSLS